MYKEGQLCCLGAFQIWNIMQEYKKWFNYTRNEKTVEIKLEIRFRNT